MQKTLLKCIGVVVCTLIFVTAVGVFSLSAGETKNTVQQNTKVSVPKYTFTVYQNKLALYERGFAMPVEIFDVYLDTLPKEEQEKIKAGICTESDAEIQKIIEDYTS
ncbi:MAG: hypothetical protein ACI4LI_09895 [Candidatus Fimenecus sp.]